VIFRQFVDHDLGCASYLVGEADCDEAVVVDPAFEIAPYLEAAEAEGVRIVRALETHTHADHVSGHGRLALEHGIPVGIHPAAAAEYEHDPLEDGDEAVVGNVALRVLHTPGHRPEHCCFAVVDRTRADEPWLVLTGDSLFVGDTARPDLAVEAEEGARGLWASLQRLLELPDGVEVYPGHVAGSLCGVGMSSKASTTIGFERRFNPMLDQESEERFVDASARVRSPRPPNVDRLVALNRGPFVPAPAALTEADPVGEAALLDVRAADEFAAGHVPGALNVPLVRSGFATRAAFVLSPDEPTVIHAGSGAEAEEAARRLRAVGFLELAGYVTDPPAPERLEPIGVDELERLLGDDGVEVIDVRELYERDDGYIPGSRNIPYRLLRAYEEELPRDRPIVTICESGARAAVAASILAAAGFEARPVLHGGIREWQARGRQTVKFRRCGS
jgi:hydroxyacylglutathione hydrolase